MPEHILAKYKSMRWQVPYLELLLSHMTHKSPVMIDCDDVRKTELFGDQVFKAYSLKSMVTEKAFQHTLYMEYAITKQAIEHKCQNVIQLQRLCFAEDHLALNFKHY